MTDQHIGDPEADELDCGKKAPPTNERTFWDELKDLEKKGLVKVAPMMKAARTAEEHAAAWSRRIAHELDTFEHER